MKIQVVSPISANGQALAYDCVRYEMEGGALRIVGENPINKKEWVMAFFAPGAWLVVAEEAPTQLQVATILPVGKKVQ